MDNYRLRAVIPQRDDEKETKKDKDAKIAELSQQIRTMMNLLLELKKDIHPPS